MIKPRKKKGETASRKRDRSELEEDTKNVEDEESTSVVVQPTSVTPSAKKSALTATTKKSVDTSSNAEVESSKDKGFASSREMSTDNVTTTAVVGPERKSANVRAISSIDYQPGICKDYAKNGYCGYGDACIFAHIREEWKSGWIQDKEWEEEQKKKKMRLIGPDKESVKLK